MLAKILAFFAYLFGRKVGQEAERQADVVATNQTAQEITHAEAAAPVTRAAIIARLHDDPNA
jgi:hypothetical protein